MCRGMEPVGAKGSLLCLIIIFSVFIATSPSWNMIFALSCRRWDVVKSPDDAQLNSDPGEHLHWFIAKTPNLQKEEIIHVMFPSRQLHPTWLPVRSSNSCHTICRYFILFWGVRRKLDSFVSSQHGASCRLLTEPVQAGAAFPPGSWWTSVGSENLWTHAGFCIFSFETRGIISASGVYDSVRGLSGWRRQMLLNKAENLTSLLVCFPQSYEDSKGRGTVHNEEEEKKKKNFMKLCLTNSSLVVPSCKFFYMNFFLSLS